MTTLKQRKNAFLVSGEAGCGKSFFIRQEAKLHKAKLFRWNVRIDRSLREGREILHQQVRSKEPMYVWIEGADDLTQEAQAFLRRLSQIHYYRLKQMEGEPVGPRALRESGAHQRRLQDIVDAVKRRPAGVPLLVMGRSVCSVTDSSFNLKFSGQPPRDRPLLTSWEDLWERIAA